MFARPNASLLALRRLPRRITTDVDHLPSIRTTTSGRHHTGCARNLRPTLDVNKHGVGGVSAAVPTKGAPPSALKSASPVLSSGTATVPRRGRCISSCVAANLGTMPSVPIARMAAIGARAPLLQSIGYPVSFVPNINFQQRRNMAIRKSKRGLGGGNRKNTPKPDVGPLRNEYLVASLISKSNARKGGAKISQEPGLAVADTFQVRLVIDRGKTIPSDVSVVSLSEAIRQASELGVDLVDMNSTDDPPVIKAVDINKLLYEKKRGEAARTGAGGAGGEKLTKEYKFRAGIADHDLQRKTDGMLSYLAKGHPTRVTLTSNRRNLNLDKDAIVTTLDRVREIVGDRADEVRNMKGNERGTHGSLLLHPNKNSAKDPNKNIVKDS